MAARTRRRSSRARRAAGSTKRASAARRCSPSSPCSRTICSRWLLRSLEHEHHDFFLVLVGGALVARGGDELPAFGAAAVELVFDGIGACTVAPRDCVKVGLE